MRYEDLSAEDKAAHDEAQAQGAARRAASDAKAAARKVKRDTALELASSRDNSVPAIRAKLNAVIEFLASEHGVEIVAEE